MLPSSHLDGLPFRRMCPIFQISNVTGENMDLLKMFLNLLPSRTHYKIDEPAEFQIDDTYSVPVGQQTLGSALSRFPPFSSVSSLFFLKNSNQTECLRVQATCV